MADKKSSAAGATYPEGVPINASKAMDIKEALLGNPRMLFVTPWEQGRINFKDIDGPYPYGLKMTRGEHVHPVLACIQGHMMRFFIFGDDEHTVYSSRMGVQFEVDLRPKPSERKVALARALAMILWNAGGKKTAYYCTLQDRPCFESTSQMRFDGCTERLVLHEFKDFAKLAKFILVNHAHLEDGFGLLSFLYSAVLSRTSVAILNDMGFVCNGLFGDRQVATPALINLLLRGKAIPDFQNGTSNDSSELDMESSASAVSERSEIGYLHYERSDGREPIKIGSCLKTPKFPIWVTCTNRTYGVLWGNSQKLLFSWEAERFFILCYYNGLATQPGHCKLTLAVDTKTYRQRVGSVPIEHDPAKRLTPLQYLLWSKWEGCTVDWNAMEPFY